MASLAEVACPVCLSRRSREAFRTRDYTRRDTLEFGVRRCDVCGCGYLSPRPTIEDIGRYYDADFYWSFEGGRELSAQELLSARAPQLRAKARYLKAERPGRLLDIGAQKGEFVYSMRQQGWDAEGLEFQTLPRNIFDVPMRYGEITQIDWGEQRFDCITMWAVLEHVYEPRAVASCVSRLLAPGGRFIALVTNFNSVQARIYRQDDFPRHLTLFTHGSLRRLLEDTGLTVKRMQTEQSVFGGSLYGGIVYLTKRLCGYSLHDVFAEWKDATDPLAFCCKWRGRRSTTMRWISRTDRALTWLPERVLDRLGCGFLLTVEATKPPVDIGMKHGNE